MIARSLATFGLLLLGAAPALAFGGHSQKGTVVGCYQQVTIPPVYKTVRQQVMISPGRCEQRVTPAVYGTEQRQVIVSDVRQVVHTTPAQYQDVTMTREVRAPYTKWTSKCGMTCQVAYPGKYKTYTSKVMVTPPQSWTETVPAQYATQTFQVVIKPAQVENVCTPPVYGWVDRQVMVSPARTEMRLVR